MANVNYLAVLVATVLAYLGGWAWYGALFNKAWLSANKLTPERLAEMKAERSPAVAMIAGFVIQLIIALGLALLKGWTGYQTWQHGLAIGLFVWFFFAAMVTLMAAVYQGRSMTAFAIDAGYQLVYFALIGAVLGAWQ
jgi:hypothetical protein